MRTSSRFVSCCKHSKARLDIVTEGRWAAVAPWRMFQVQIWQLDAELEGRRFRAPVGQFSR